jgi:hypothetical protein
MVVANLVSYPILELTRQDLADRLEPAVTVDMVAVAEVTAVMEAVAPTVVAHMVPHLKVVTVDMADTPPDKINHNTAVARNTDIPVLDKPGNQDNRVAPVGLLIKRENPALLVLPKENGLSDHYGRKEANCVEDAPKAG